MTQVGIGRDTTHKTIRPASSSATEEDWQRFSARTQHLVARDRGTESCSQKYVGMENEHL
jgi:hypothetical protein